MRPVDCFGAVADILTRIVGSPYREQEMSTEEWAKFTDQVLLLAERERSKGEGQP